MKPMVVFSDLDGSLLNRRDYRYQAAEPALAALERAGIPLILVSSKTAPEMLRVRSLIGNTHPLVCENGCLVMIPQPRLAELKLHVDERSLSDGYYYDYRGVEREQILSVLSDLKGDFRFTGFAWMTDEEVAKATGLTLEEAVLAGQRKASEPIVWRDSPEQLPAFRRELAENKLRLIRGGRFQHVLGHCDKADAVKTLLAHYRDQYGQAPFSVALGDSANDQGMLGCVDQPIVIPNPDSPEIDARQLPNVMTAPAEGAAGWNAAMMKILENPELGGAA